MFFHISLRGIISKKFKGERDTRISIFGDYTSFLISWRIWQCPNEWNSGIPKWKYGSIDFHPIIFGKHKVTWDEEKSEELKLEFIEGSYRVLIIEGIRTDSWKRWFDKKSITYKCDMIDKIETPHNRYGSISFSSTKIKSIGDALKYVNDLIIKERGSWVPKKARIMINRNEKINNILGL